MLKKSEKGPLIGYQRSFFSGRNLLQRVDALLTDKFQAALLPIITLFSAAVGGKGVKDSRKNYRPYNKQAHVSGYHHNCNVLQLKHGSCCNKDTLRN